MKKSFFKIFIIFFAFIIFFSCGFFRKQKNYNVLLITIDTWRYDRLSFVSKKHVDTPQIDKIAEEGIFFTRNFVNNPLTLPSHTNILTGTTALWHGVHENAGFRLAEKFLTIAEHLKKYNYSTSAFIGAFPLDKRFGLSQGFDYYDDKYPSKNILDFAFPERKAEKVIDSAILWLKENYDKKWFVWVHVFDPHQPYNPPEPYRTKYKEDLYSGEVAYVDKELGRLFKFLKDKGLLKKTIIVITGDHGEGLGEHGETTHGYFAYNSTLHVPLIIYYPGVVSKIINSFVQEIDIFPTICDILRIKIPSDIQGKSLLPLISGKIKKYEREIYFESLSMYYNRGWAPLRGMIIDGMKYIDLPIKELYDLRKDFDEKNNIWGKFYKERYERKLKVLIKRLSNRESKASRMVIGAEEMKKLKTLGYVVSRANVKKSRFTAKDDLKTLLPIHRDILRGIKLFSSGNYKKAIEIYEKILRKRKDIAQVYVNLATIYRKIGRINEARNILEAGFKNIPNNIEILSSLGITLVEVGELEKAVKILSIAESKDKNNVDVYNYLGVAYWKMGDFEKALFYYNKALEIDDNDATIFNNLGSLYLSAYQFDEAVKYFKKALELDPQLVGAYNGLGATYIKKGLYDEAEKELWNALKINKMYLYTYYNLILLYSEKRRDCRKLEEVLNIMKKEKLFEYIPPKERKDISEMISRCSLSIDF